jgi:hemoglobin
MRFLRLQLKGHRDGLLGNSGPHKYTGKSMADSHAHLKITAEEWEAFLDDFQQTLNKFAVPVEGQAELKAIVNSTRPDIVVASDAAVA